MDKNIIYKSVSAMEVIGFVYMPGSHGFEYIDNIIFKRIIFHKLTKHYNRY